MWETWQFRLRCERMPRFYFNLYECGKPLADNEGQEVADVAQARALAVKEARALMSSEVQSGKLCLSCRIEVEDEERVTVFIVPFKEALQVTGL